jgi:hypothetical protein
MTAFTDWQSWLIHFAIFLMLGKWSGLKWQWALVLIVGIEVWECSDWAKLDFAYWLGKLDTWLDMFAGALAVLITKKRLI